MKRPGFSEADLAAALGDGWDADRDRGVLTTVLAERQYAGYIARQRAEAKRHEAMEGRRIPAWLAFGGVSGLRTEARLALERFRPATFGQASRLEGVTPADLTVLMVACRKGAGAV